MSGNDEVSDKWLFLLTLILFCGIAYRSLMFPSWSLLLEIPDRYLISAHSVPRLALKFLTRLASFLTSHLQEPHSAL